MKYALLYLSLVFLMEPSATRAQPSDAACCTVLIEINVVNGVGTVYLAGNLAQLGPWRPDGVEMSGSGTRRQVELHVPRGTDFEYKFTLGSWDREALGPSGTVMANHRIRVDGPTKTGHQIVDFKKDPSEYIADWQGSGVRGRLIYWTDVGSEFLDQKRNVAIWLPPQYDQHSRKRFPVLYMHDGQNLFDPRIANTGVDWGVDETVIRLVDEGLMAPVIVVGVWNSSDRGIEYSPWHRAPDYANFLIRELMPRVNQEFRTLTGPGNTAAMGSSMGGLLSFYLVSRHSDVFGACGCMSTHFVLTEAMAIQNLPNAGSSDQPDETPYILRDIQAGLTLPEHTRYWFDYGTEELDSYYGSTHDAVRLWLEDQGLVEGENYEMRVYQGANHSEAAWRSRLADPLTFLFGSRRR